MQSSGIVLFRSVTMLCGTDNIMQMFSTFNLNVGFFLQNNVGPTKPSYGFEHCYGRGHSLGEPIICNSCWLLGDNEHSIVVRQASIISQFEGSMIT